MVKHPMHPRSITEEALRLGDSCVRKPLKRKVEKLRL